MGVWRYSWSAVEMFCSFQFGRMQTRGGRGSGVPDSTPTGFRIVLSDADPESKFMKNQSRTRSHFSISAVSAESATHRWRSKRSFGSAKDFCPNFHNLHKKLSCNIAYRFLVWLSKKCSSLVFVKTLGAILWSQTTLGAIFVRIFRDFA